MIHLMSREHIRFWMNMLWIIIDCTELQANYHQQPWQLIERHNNFQITSLLSIIVKAFNCAHFCFSFRSYQLDASAHFDLLSWLHIFILSAFSLALAINQCHSFLLASPVNPKSNSNSEKVFFVDLHCH